MSETDPLPTAQVTPPHLPQPSDARGAVERLAFEKVLKEESDYIECRRTNIGQTSTPTSKDTFGLAFSGGGIRSASFNLGVLQAFAEKKLIGSLDYLSTVSGGGYIGSWLAAWLHRDGNIGRVENLLAPDRKANALVPREFCKEDLNKSADYVFEDEPTPLYHLRAYSSFLTPKPGFLSVQSWTLFAIYLRNVFLNLLVIIPLSITIILAMVFALKLYMVNEYSVILGYLMLLLCIPCFAFSAVWIARSIKDVRNNRPKLEPLAPASPPGVAMERRPYWATTYIPAVISIVLGCFLLGTFCHGPNNNWIGKTYDALGKIGSFILIGLGCAIVGFIHTGVNDQSWRSVISGQRDNRPEKWLLASFVAGCLLALLCLMSLWSMESIDNYKMFGVTIEKESIRLTLIVPLLLLSMGVAETMQIGILGKLEDPIVRDKWSACNAYCALAGTAWFGLFFVVLILPEILFLPHFDTARFAGPIGWAVSSIVAAFLAHSPASSGTKSRWIDWLVQLGPPIFLVGMMVGLTTFVYMWVLQQRTDAHELNWNSVHWIYVALSLLFASLVTAVGCRMVDVNVFSLQELYQNRLVRTFLGASRPRAQRCGAPFVSSGDPRYPDPITDLDGGDDIALSKLVNGYEHCKPENCTQELPPIFLINTSMNRVGDSSLNNQERMAESFTLGSLHCGCPTTQFIRTCDGYGENIQLGTAFAISGAAVSPNMGYYSSPVVTGLLTLFNLRLGAWLGNPMQGSSKPASEVKGWLEEFIGMFGVGPKWTAKMKIESFDTTLSSFTERASKLVAVDTDPALSAGPTAGWVHLFREMLGLTTSKSNYIYLSDGGHFDNLGVYELLHRRCRYIVACDAGEDPDGSCNELAMIIRKAFIDFGIKIEIDIDALRVDPTTSLSKRRFAIGKITYPPRNSRCEPEIGHIVYVKMTLDGTESADIRSYKVKHPDFPHRTTADQFFTESKFESFRKLGYEIANEMLESNACLVSSKTGFNDQSTRLPQAKLNRYLDEIVAYGSINLGPDWGAKNELLGQRYEELQSRLLSNRHLRHLRAEIEKRTQLFQLIDRIELDEANVDVEILEKEKKTMLQNLGELSRFERNEQESNVEGRWIAKAINLISDVFETIKLKEYNPKLREGWIRIARRWMLTSSFQNHWKNWKEDFPIVVNEFYEKLKTDKYWNP